MSESNIHPAAETVDRLMTDCELKTTRGSGPGGQHRNKVDSAVVITHQPSKIVGQASERRSQHENRKVAIERLRINLALGLRVDRGGEGYAPSPLWLSRVRSRRIFVNPQHEDFPALLAEALDVLSACQMDPVVAAAKLHCSTSQLIKFLKLQPLAFRWLNRQRQSTGLKPLN